MIVYNPLPKWRKEKHSCWGLLVTIRLRRSRLCYCGAGGEHPQHACAGTQSSWSTLKHQWMKRPGVLAAAL